jgi:hypothetical protein
MQICKLQTNPGVLAFNPSSYALKLSTGLRGRFFYFGQALVYPWHLAALKMYRTDPTYVLVIMNC